MNIEDINKVNEINKNFEVKANIKTRTRGFIIKPNSKIIINDEEFNIIEGNISLKGQIDKFDNISLESKNGKAFISPIESKWWDESSFEKLNNKSFEYELEITDNLFENFRKINFFIWNVETPFDDLIPLNYLLTKSYYPKIDRLNVIPIHFS